MKLLPNESAEETVVPAASSLKQVRASLIEQFEKASVSDPSRSADLLLKHALGLTDADLLVRFDMSLASCDRDKVNQIAQRRLEHEPVSRIIGKRAFWNKDFKLSPETLDPRADTEVIVEAAIAWLKINEVAQANPKILDIGTGTGCILLSILDEMPQATGIGIDVSSGAVSIAKENAVALDLAHRCQFTQMSWEGLAAPDNPDVGTLAEIDLIVSNPPYIRTDDIPELAKEVRNFDPVIALDGSRDGLAAYRSIISVLLSAGFSGTLIFEVGADQANEVKALLTSAQIGTMNEHQLPTVDLEGHTRAVIATFSRLNEKK